MAALLEEGEHGYLAARVVSQVIKAYVENQRRQPTKVASGTGKTEIGAVWSTPDADGYGDRLQGGRFFVDLPKKHRALATASAPIPSCSM